MINDKIAQSNGIYIGEDFDFMRCIVQNLVCCYDAFCKVKDINSSILVFGVKSHAVSCKLLEYGYLAVCSQHRFVDHPIIANE